MNVLKQIWKYFPLALIAALAVGFWFHSKTTSALEKLLKNQTESYEQQLKAIDAINKAKDAELKKITAEYEKKIAALAVKHAKDLAEAKKKKTSTQAAYAKLPPSELSKKLASEFDLQVVP